MSNHNTPARRREDADPDVLIVESARQSTTGEFREFVNVRRFRVTLEGEKIEPLPEEVALERLHDVAMLFPVTHGNGIAVPVPVSYVMQGSEQEQIMQTARELVAWRRERVRAAKRIQMPDRLLAFAEDIARVSTADDVYDAAMQHVPRIVDGWACMVFTPSASDSEEVVSIAPVKHPTISLGVSDISLPERVRFGGAELIDSKSIYSETHGTFSPLIALFHECELVKAAFIPLGDFGGFVLAERRAERVFDADDWHLLRSLARQIELALDRVRLFEQIHQLSLTDPLTGIGNRRRLDVFLDHSIALARRGEPLTLVLVDLDDFKMINDRDGHLRGDQILRIVARTLQEQIRGSDMVVRFGGDEFLMVLQGSAEGAEVLLDRVRKQLADVVQFSVGVAQFETTTESAEQLVNEADRQLYKQKNPDIKKAAVM